MVKFMLVLMALVLVFALLGAGSSFSTLTGGHPRTAWWSKIFAGVAWLLLGLLGLLASPYLSGFQKTSTLILSILIGALGYFLLKVGIRLRRAPLTPRR